MYFHIVNNSTSRFRFRSTVSIPTHSPWYTHAMKTHQGSCHCGSVRYEVTAEFTEGMRCNCTHCKRKGFLLAFVPESSFTLKSGEENLTQYQFNKKHIDHLFCKTCGVESFARGADHEGNVMIAINLNCLLDFDTTSIKVTEYDGLSL
jgi:hypothetical protein